MKKLLLTAIAIFTAAAAYTDVRAADLPVKAVVPVSVRASCAQFGGFYVGGNAGWGYYDYRWSDHDAWSGENADNLQRGQLQLSKSGFVGGVQGGYNWQRGCTLFGVEADYAWGSIKNHTFETDGGTGTGLDTLTVESRLRGLGSIRARSGIIVDDLLLYLTGGIAVGNFRRTFSQTNINDEETPFTEVEAFTYSKTKWGWTAGFGTEWALNNNWSIKSEVLYARFENDERSFLCTAGFTCGTPGEIKRFGNQDTIWTTKIGINYRWGVR